MEYHEIVRYTKKIIDIGKTFIYSKTIFKTGSYCNPGYSAKLR